MKGVIQENHVAVNKYNLIVVGMPPLTPVKVSGLDEVLETVELPDRTRASGGNTKATEFTMEIPSHHAIEVQAMETWFQQGKDPVQPGYKKAAVLIMKRIGAGVPRQFQLIGVFTSGRKNSDLEMKNEGDMAVDTWKMSVDDIKPLT